MRSSSATYGTGRISIDRIERGLVQRVVVVDVLAHGERRRLDAAVEEDGGAGDPLDRRLA